MWQIFKRRPVADQAHLELVSQIHGLSLRVKQLEETLAALEDKHERLRGRFYALNGSRGEPPPGGKSKAQLIAEWKARGGV